MSETINKVYLGDSVYASYDGYYVWLTTENGLPNDPSNTILLEPRVSRALINYLEARAQEDFLATHLDGPDEGGNTKDDDYWRIP